jgi:predicted Fe-Mo cluster-binding NifX family protein
MKLMIPVDEKNMQTPVCISFGRAPYFMLYDTDSQTAEFIDNDAVHRQGGAGIRAAQLISDFHPDALLTPRCGDNAADVIKGAGIPMMKAIKGKATDNVQAYKEGRLEVLGETHPGLHQHGGC